MGIQDVKLLIVYATKYGHAEKIARRIADACANWGVASAVADVRTLDPVDLPRFDTALFVASIHYGRHPRAFTRFVTKNRVHLTAMRTALISVSGDAAERDTLPRAEEYVHKLFATTGWTASEWHLAGGAISFSKYNWFVRWVMRLSLAERGVAIDLSRDHEQTDWEAVLGFARAFITTQAVRVA